MCETQAVSNWGPATFGDPCRECGYAWNLTAQEAAATIKESPAAYREAVRDATGSESAPDLSWNAAAYVAHVTDNLRIWGERLAAAAESEEPIVVEPYDSDALAASRRYESIPLAGVLSGLDEAVASWERGWNRSGDARVFVHPDRGRVTTADVALTNAHDVVHHLYDVHRCLDAQ